MGMPQPGGNSRQSREKGLPALVAYVVYGRAIKIDKQIEV